ncbi:MAG: hypothetical protein ACK4YP_08450 [Myxococcota bacterium]
MPWLLLLACAQGRPEAYANCTVTATVVPMADDPYTWTYVYDDRGREVARSLASAEAAGEGTTTWEGDCAVLTEGEWDYGDGLWSVGKTRQTCDGHGHVEHEDWVYRGDYGTGPHEGSAAYDWSYEHDAQGRVVAVWEGVGAPGDGVTRYAWAAPCEEPVEARWASAEFSVRETRVCRLDGRDLTVEAEARDLAGNVLEFRRTMYTYDGLGRRVSRESDTGPGSDIVARQAWTWDAISPGPVEEIEERDGDVQWTVTYTYDCEG